ncbi:MAG: FHA domain-containing protein, partial [Deltaproteobacteria bacterium]|nr:FHA domain-containing protein [Deltaproteobacteria bacterium]
MSRSRQPSLILSAGEDTGQPVTLTDRPLRVGRAPTNDLVITDGRVSAHHVVFWLEPGAVWVEDLGSRNGVSLGGKVLHGPTPLDHGDEVSLAPDVTLRVDAPDGVVSDIPQILTVEVIGTPVRMPLYRARFTIGSAEDADLRFPEAEARAATLLVDPSGEVMLGRGVEESPLALGQRFEVAGRDLRVVPIAGGGRAATQGIERSTYPYVVRVQGNGPRAPVVTVEERASGSRFSVDTDNRAVLLYLLAKRLREDRDAGVNEDAAGWVADSDLAAGIWGKGRGAADANGLNVLIYRLRGNVRESGFDPWFVEKRRLRVRIVAAEVTLE